MDLNILQSEKKRGDDILHVVITDHFAVFLRKLSLSLLTGQMHLQLDWGCYTLGGSKQVRCRCGKREKEAITYPPIPSHHKSGFRQTEPESRMAEAIQARQV